MDEKHKRVYLKELAQCIVTRENLEIEQILFPGHDRLTLKDFYLMLGGLPSNWARVIQRYESRLEGWKMLGVKGERFAVLQNHKIMVDLDNIELRSENRYNEDMNYTSTDIYCKTLNEIAFLLVRICGRNVKQATKLDLISI